MGELILPMYLEEGFKPHILEASLEEYHNIKDAVHSGTLLNMVKSPHAARFFLMNQKKRTPSMRFGAMAHEAILEGPLFLKRYVVEPLFEGFTAKGVKTTSKNSKDVMEQYEAWLNSLPEGTQIMSQEEHDKLLFMMDSLMSHSFVRDSLKDAKPEYKKVWRDPVTGLKCVSSDDAVNFKYDIWMDVKTTTSCKWEDFRRTVESLRYDIPCAHYRRGNKELHGRAFEDEVWIALESVAPYECRVHPVDEAYRKTGEAAVHKAMLDLNTSIKNESWPQGQVVIESGKTSSWFFNENKEIIEA